jgi:hypothetical protein
VLRLTDQLLNVAEELREARDELQTLLERPPAPHRPEGEEVCHGR